MTFIKASLLAALVLAAGFPMLASPQVISAPSLPPPPPPPGNVCDQLWNKWADNMNKLEALNRDCAELDRQCRLIWNYDQTIFEVSCSGHIQMDGCNGTSIYYWHEAEAARLAAIQAGCGWAR